MFSKTIVDVLKKGLKFTPTPCPDQNNLKVSIKKFTRKIRLKEYFFDNKQQENSSQLRNKSKFNPPRGRDIILDRVVDYINDYPVGQHQRKHIRQNLNKGERKALLQLKNDRDIIIKEADKGSAVVIMNKQFYEHKILEMLQNGESYQNIPNSQDKETLKKIKVLLNKCNDVLQDSEEDYLLNFDSKNSNFYGLPKIHKSKTILEAVKEQNSEYVIVANPLDLTFRPIVAGPVCPTSRLSNLVDILLKPFITYVPSYVRDDLDFLNHLPKTINYEQTFVTFDVNNLYGSINHDLGRKGLLYWLEKHQHLLPNKMPKEFIIEAVDIILQNNTFQFGDNHYKQILGCPMGSKFSPNYAILALGYLEVQLYETVRTKYGEDFEKYVRENFKRYIDDCFIIWDDSRRNIEDFHKLLNSLNPQISFSMEKSKTSIPFLDINVKRKHDNTILTDIFYKSTDTKSYLNFHSCHPRATKTNIPFNLARRICTIVEDQNLRHHRLLELKNFLKIQGYPESLINTGITKAKLIPLNELRKCSQKVPDENVITFVHEHNPWHQNSFQFVRDSISMLNTSDRMAKIMNSMKIINAKKQPFSLKKILTKAKFDTNNTGSESTTGVTKCKNSRCLICKHHLITGNSFKFDNIIFRIRFSLSCSAKNVIYVIKCNGCSASYIGETVDFRKRMNLHKSHIKTLSQHSLYVSKHINECPGNNSKDINNKFSVMPIYQTKENCKDTLTHMESRFIDRFKPALNK